MLATGKSIAVVALASSLAAVFWVRPYSLSDGPMPAEEAAAKMVVPEGFHTTLFAAEPAVQQPINFCIDDRGRLWVAEAYNYPQHGTKPGDRILILEDSDGDGRHDKRTVFYDRLNYVTGIEVGFGGAWVMSPPFFYFIPDRNGDDVPDEEPQILLDGFGNHANSHNLANGFAWGPDGWLYGTHGRTNWSRIGKPGCKDEERQTFDGGVYRYHPVRHVWEPYADGTTNPWGIDWNDLGDAFVSNCVNPHLFQVIEGAHYEPWRNRESSRFAYQRIDTIADHLHYLGGPNFHEGIGSPAEDLLGGGHAHCGTMVYLGDNWPEKYRNHVFMNNIHGKRVNHDLLKRSGSGYVASHAPDVIRSQDPWHMGVTLQYGPDGGVFMSDWSDTGECHSVRNTQRSTGRIFKITYGKLEGQLPTVAKASTEELVRLQLHRNEWHARHARRRLQELAASGQSMLPAKQLLLEMFQTQTSLQVQLRALWALHAIGHADLPFLQEQLRHEKDAIRGWAVQLIGERREQVATVIEPLLGLAKQDPSPWVRLKLASLLQRMDAAQRWGVAEALASHEEDEKDQNLPLMCWYGIEPLIDADLLRFVSLAEKSKLSIVRNHIARRTASHPKGAPGLERLSAILSETSSSDVRKDILRGILRGLEGRRNVEMPKSWERAFQGLLVGGDTEIKQTAIEVALVFNDPRALDSLRRIAIDAKEDGSLRKRAIRSLVAKKGKGTEELLISLLEDGSVQEEVVRGLAEFSSAPIPLLLIEKYGSLSPVSRQDALQCLASRPAWGRLLVEAMAKDRIPRKDVTAFTVRQLRTLGDPSIDERLVAVWGEFRTSAGDKEKAIASYKKALTPNALARANLSNGRAIFQKSCANCHRLFGEGGNIGPEITGAQRTNLDYVLQNLIDPSAAVSKDYQMEILLTDDGRTITGMIVDETEMAITVQTVNERIVVPLKEIEKRTLSSASMMPEGILQALANDQVRDLVAYLASPKQVELPTPTEK